MTDDIPPDLEPERVSDYRLFLYGTIVLVLWAVFITGIHHI